MAEALVQPRAVPVEYPESDGAAVDSMAQWNAVAEVVFTLRRFFADRALVAANMGVYFREGDPRGAVVPDLFVALGKPLIDTPDTYLTWEQGKPPDFVLEVASKSTFRKDRREKIAIYRTVGVKEYFLHDAKDRFLRPRLQGYRYSGRSKGGGRTYEPVESTVLPDGTICLPSAVLNLTFRAVPGTQAPQIFGPDGAMLPSPEDAAAEDRRLRQEAERERREAERELAVLRKRLDASGKQPGSH